MVRLAELKGNVIKPGLETVSELLRRLGNPQLEYKSVHIAGTNGKGSCAATLHEILLRAGYRAALYTSPHLRRFNERVKINRDEIGDSDLKRLDAIVGNACDGIEPTYFEYTTAMAFLYFAEKSPDVAVVEVGLGGRLDATNTVDSAVSVITPLSMDHRDFLGDTIESVAFEKAGIMKRGVKAVISRQPEKAMKVVEKHAAETGAITVVEGRDFHADDARYPYFDFHGRNITLKKLKCGLIGRHQVQNSATVLAAAETLIEAGFGRISESAMRTGVAEVRWRGRLELIEGTPPVLLDGTHNPGGAEVLSRALSEDFAGKKVRMIIGMQVTKDLDAVLAILAPRVSEIYAVLLREVVPYAPDLIAEKARALGVEATAHRSLKEAFDAATKSSGRDDIVLIAGSLYLVGEAEELLGRKN